MNNREIKENMKYLAIQFVYMCKKESIIYTISHAQMKESMYCCIHNANLNITVIEVKNEQCEYSRSLSDLLSSIYSS